MLIALLLTTSFIVVAGLVTAQLALSNLQAAVIEKSRVNAQFATDAGIDDAIQHLNQDGDWPGSGGEITLFEDGASRATYQTTVTDDTSDPLKKFIHVTGRTYSPKTSATPRVERKYEVELRGVSGGNFSLVTGVGGLYMSNNSKIVGGNVYVNGEIEMSNSAQIGLTSSPVNVKAAHQNCPVPPNTTYPLVCNVGESGQPITIQNNAKIYGEVQATNQTSGAGMSSPGLVPGSPPPSALPTHDRDAQKAAVASEQTGSAAGCSNSTKTWPANLKINGNVTLSNSCRVTVAGNVWITGNVTLSNSAELIVQNGQSTPPVIMIDGSSGLQLANGTMLRSNSANIGFRVITYYSSAACSPDCADVTGPELYNSRNHQTISITNNASGPHTEFYARWTRVELSNGGNIGALVGQTVRISNSGTITFGTSVTGIGEAAAWVIESYKRTF